MNLLGTARAVDNKDFRDRVHAAVIISAQDIVSSGAMTDRSSAALFTLQHPETAAGNLMRFCWLTAANAAIAASVQPDGSVSATDSDIHYVVSGIWWTLYPDDES